MTNTISAKWKKRRQCQVTYIDFNKNEVYSYARCVHFMCCIQIKSSRNWFRWNIIWIELGWKLRPAHQSNFVLTEKNRRQHMNADCQIMAASIFSQTILLLTIHTVQRDPFICMFWKTAFCDLFNARVSIICCNNEMYAKYGICGRASAFMCVCNLVNGISEWYWHYKWYNFNGLAFE